MPENVEPTCWIQQEYGCIKPCWHCAPHDCPNHPNRRCNCAPGRCVDDE